MEHIIGFFGGDSQTGTTMTAWSFAERLAMQGRKVLLVFGSGNDDQVFFLGKNGKSLDDLKAAIRSGQIEREDLLSCFEQRKSLWILPGTKNSLTAEYFLENTFKILLENIGSDFDEVIIDGGSNFRLGLTISALNVCTYRYFVLTQEAKCLHRYLQNKNRLLEPLGLDGTVILNQYRKDPALFLKKDVCRMLDAEGIAVVPFVEGGWQAEMEKKNLLQSPRYVKAIDDLVSGFVDFDSGEKKVKKWKKLFI